MIMLFLSFISTWKPIKIAEAAVVRLKSTCVASITTIAVVRTKAKSLVELASI